MLSALFQIIIYPIYALIEMAFNVFYNLFQHNIMLTIFYISLIVNFLCLPLYLNADKLQHEEKEIQKKLEKKVKSIKKHFKGDERFMLLQTYYRQNNYHPIMSLRLSFSLLLQIPFFIGAYLFFSHLPVFQGTGIGIIQDLSKPDGLICFKNLSINFLPVLMTFINLLAGWVYAKNLSKKENIQLWIMSLVFLILLYNSPSGLVIYWTFNNLFSLIKNLGLTNKNPKNFLYFSLAFILFITLIVFKKYSINPAVIIFLVTCTIFWQKFNFSKYLTNFNPKPVYILSISAIVLLFGLMIPTGALATSPGEFLSGEATKTPLYLMAFPFLQAFGIFGFWGAVFYTLSDKKVKNCLALFAFWFLAVSIFNMFYIKLPNSTMDCAFAFDSGLKYSTTPEETCAYLFILAAIASLIIAFVIKNKTEIIKKTTSVIIIAACVCILFNTVKIYTKFSEYKKSLTKENAYNITDTLNFSKDKRNVVIICIDRAINSFLPLIFEERPELKEIFTGFKYYPNTVSFHGHTIAAYPSLAGGYEYTPVNCTKTRKLYRHKYNESTLVLPEIFKNKGWRTVITDSPYSGFLAYETDDSAFKKNGHKHFYLAKQFTNRYLKEKTLPKTSRLQATKRNFLYFSFLSTAPAEFRKFLYNDGNYLNTGAKNIPTVDKYTIGSYAGLYYLPNVTDFTSDKGLFAVINNNLTHIDIPISYKDFDLPEKESKFSFDEYAKRHYIANSTALIKIGDYLNFLKENDVYDNTRIIIVSDHGTKLNNPKFDKFQNETVTKYNALLLVKDFNSKEPIKTVNDFMTNADVPLLATKGIIENPINPYTGKKISNNEKAKGAYILSSSRWQIDMYTNVSDPFFSGDTVHYVENNIFEKKNWKIDIPYKEVLK